jgi:hypothetical protein
MLFWLFGCQSAPDATQQSLLPACVIACQLTTTLTQAPVDTTTFAPTRTKTRTLQR